MESNSKIFFKVIGLELLLMFFFTLNGALMSNFESHVFNYFVLVPLAVGIFFYLVITKKWSRYFSLDKLRPIQETVILSSPLLVILMLVLIGNKGLISASFTDLLLMLSLQLLVVAFIEEMIFRGFMLKILFQKGFKKAVLITSILFAITHSFQLLGGKALEDTILQIIYALAVGMVLSLLIVNQQSIIVTILFHGLNNFFKIMGQGDKNSVFNYVIIALLIVHAIYLWNRANKLPKDTISDLHHSRTLSSI